MIYVSNINLPAGQVPALHLGMAPKAQVQVALDEQLGVKRAVWVVAHWAALAQRRMLEHEWPGLLAMALCAPFIETPHRQTSARFEDIAAMRVMALNAIHSVLRHRVMLGELKFR